MKKNKIISLPEKYPKLFFKLRDIYKQKNIDDLKQIIEWSEQFIEWIKYDLEYCEDEPVSK
jgi:hypothetical protein